MSDVSALSQEYSAAAELSQRLGAALLLLKRLHFRLPGSEDVSRDVAASTRRELEQLVRAVAEQFESTVEGISAHKVATHQERLPAALIARLLEDNKGSPNWFLQDLRGVADVLAQPGGKVGEDEIAVLEKLTSAADAERSHVFRQMTRRRV